MFRRMLEKLSADNFFRIVTNLHLLKDTAIKDVFSKMMQFAQQQNLQEMQKLLHLGFSVDLIYGNKTVVLQLAQNGCHDAVNFLIDFCDGSIFEAIKGWAIRNDTPSQIEINKLLKQKNSTPIIFEKLIEHLVEGYAFGKHFECVKKWIEKNDSENQLKHLKCLVIKNYAEAGCIEEINEIISLEQNNEFKCQLMIWSLFGFALANNANKIIETVQFFVSSKQDSLDQQKIILKKILQYYALSGHVIPEEILILLKNYLYEVDFIVDKVEFYATGGHINQLISFLNENENKVSSNDYPQLAAVLFRGFIKGCHFPQAKFVFQNMSPNNDFNRSVMDDFLRNNNINALNKIQQEFKFKFVPPTGIALNNLDLRAGFISRHLSNDEDRLFLFSVLNKPWLEEIRTFLLIHGSNKPDIDKQAQEIRNRNEKVMKKYSLSYEPASLLSVNAKGNISILFLSICFSLWQEMGSKTGIIVFPKEIFWRIISEALELNEKTLKHIYGFENDRHYDFQFSLKTKFMIFKEPKYKEFKDHGTRFNNNMSLLKN